MNFEIKLRKVFPSQGAKLKKGTTNLWAARLIFAHAVSAIMIVCLIDTVGLAESFRPGAPSISRMLQDNPASLKTVATFLILYIGGFRCYFVFHLAAGHSQLAWWRLAIMSLQILAFLLVIVYDLDDYPGVHMAVAATAIVASVLHEMGTFRPKDGPIFWIHLFAMFVISATSTAYVLATNLVPHLEYQGSIALLEYTSFMMIAGMSVFNIRHLMPGQERE